MQETEFRKIKRPDKAIDRPHWVGRPHIVLDPRWKQARLFPTLAGLECTICHKQNRTPNSPKAEFLPSLVGQITFIYFAISSHLEGRLAIVTNVAVRSDGRK